METMKELFGFGINTPPDPVEAPPADPAADFDAAYHGSRPLPVQWLREVGDFQIRKQRTLRLYKQYAIDPQIDLYFTDRPYNVMRAREAAGLPSVEAFHPYVGEGGVKQIPTVTDPAQFVRVPRSYGIRDHQRTVSWLNMHGISTGNPGNGFYQCLPGGIDASEATSADLLPLGQQTHVYPASALPHFGIVITGIRKDGELIVDSEQCAAVIASYGLSNVKAWLASMG